MSIICYTGLPGDGKSYSAVENVIIPALKDKRHVAHNLMLNHAALQVVCGFPVDAYLHQIDKDDTPAQLIEKCPLGAVIVIDEVWRYWPAGAKVNEVDKEELKFFKEHRHRVGDDGTTTEILIIDQDPKTGIPAFLRALIELTYVHTKHSSLGAKTRFRVDVYTRAQSADKPSKGALLRSLQGKYKPEVWNCYISHTQAKKLGEAGLEKSVDDRANLLKGWTLRSAIVSLFVLPFAFVWAWDAFSSMATGGGTKKTSQALGGSAQRETPPRSAAHTQQADPLPQTTPKPADTVPSTLASHTQLSDKDELHKASLQPADAPQHKNGSPLWRILGVITHTTPDGKPTGEGIALVASATGRRRLDLKKHCVYDDDAVDWTCNIDGIQVTYWSGVSMGGNLNAAVVPGVADSGNQPKQLTN